MKRLFKIFIVALIFVALLPIRVDAASKIKISQKSAIVIQGDYLYLSITGTKQKATWTSSDKSIATVNKSGKVVTNGKGKVKITAKVGKSKYTCTVSVIENFDKNYKTMTDIEHAIAEQNAIEKATASGSDTTVNSNTTINIPNSSSINKDLDGKENTISGKPSKSDNSTEADELITEEASEWVDEYYLKNKYELSVNWLGEKIYLMGINDKYIITGSPKGKFEKDKIYEGEYNSFTIRFQYTNEIVINRDDLKAAGIIK